ncbi:uncharacterized protein [Haliotis asinina]|uniref:uncharacterized protein n=1 Tax=Haliotis asinina TaxID=109174 RepID=UPI003532579B
MEGLPYNLMAGTRISVLGRCTVTDLFTVALVDLATNRKVLAMEVDMSTRAVRRYHEVDGMAPGETLTAFPFTAEQSFNITLSVRVNNIQVLANNKEMQLCSYTTQALSLVSHMSIQGGITVERVDLIYP